MKRLHIAILLSLSLTPVYLSAESADAMNRADPIAIFMSFDGEHSSRAIDAMEREVEALTKSSGYHLHWRSLQDRRSDESFSDLAVVKFHGKCNMEGIQLLFSELGPDADGAALGSTKVVDGKVMPFSELECDRIRRSIAPLSIGSSPEARESLLGRAMGRVLAHELFHVFGNTEKHGHEGVAKTSYSRKDLLAERFEFSPQDSKRIERH